MDDLRLILLLIGAGVIVVVYAWSRFQSRPRKARSSRTPSDIGQQHDDPDNTDIEQELERMQQLVQGEEDEPVAEDSERLQVISVVAPDGQIFSGDNLAKAFDHNKLRYGDHGIYHRMTILNGSEKPVFSVANLVKPGTFNPDDMEVFTSPGLTLFLQLPGPIDGVEAFDDFVHTAERLAVELGGELRDEKHCVLTHQALMLVRESIVKDRIHRRIAS
jgi:cell division protein ZipA